MKPSKISCLLSDFWKKVTSGKIPYFLNKFWGKAKLGKILYYFSDFWKKTWIVFVFLAISLVISTFVTNYMIEPEYESFTTLLIGKSDDYNSEIDYSKILLIQQLSSTYREIAKSRIVAEEVINNLKLDISSEVLMDRIKVTLINDTPIIKIEVSYKDPKQASLITDEIAKVLMKEIQELMGTDNISIIDRAIVSDSPIKPNMLFNLIIAGILGIMIGSFVVVFFMNSDDKVRSWIDIQGKLNLPIIGTIFINESLKKNIQNSELKYAHTDPRVNYIEDYKTVGAYIQFLKDRDNIKSVVIASPGEQEGRSTIACNLAYSISQLDEKVLLIDGDLRNPGIHTFFGISNSIGLSNVLTEEMDYMGAINKIWGDKLDILPAGPSARNSVEIFTKMKMEKILGFVMEEYDVIIIDSPPARMSADVAILSMLSDAVLMVCSEGESSVSELTSFKEFLIRLNTNIIGVVMNKVKNKKNI